MNTSATNLNLKNAVLFCVIDAVKKQGLNNEMKAKPFPTLEHAYNSVFEKSGDIPSKWHDNFNNAKALLST
jgi:hypothetical protein